ncbi:MAG: hypothetical protein J1G30_05010, partial [Spirochaetales bacterium]|nr:hypothetical protein [Spirochaetales bacterium]
MNRKNNFKTFSAFLVLMILALFSCQLVSIELPAANTDNNAGTGSNTDNNAGTGSNTDNNAGTG